MTVDVATLVFDFKSDSAAQAEKAMDSLIAKGERLEATARKVRRATDFVNEGHRGAAGAAERSAQASMALANAEGAVEKAARGTARASAEVRAARQMEAAAMRELVTATKGYERDQQRAASAAAKAARDQAAAVQALKASVDPLAAAQDRVNAEMAEATRLYKAGAISAEQYHRATTVLAGRLNTLSTAHSGGAKAAKLQAHELANLSFQAQDVFVSLASGQNPMMVLIQQGSQVGQVLGSSRAGLAGGLKELGGIALSVLGKAGPIAIGAGVVIGLGAAFLAGEKDANAFSNALKATGSFAGIAAAEFEAMATQVAKATNGGFGNARSALLELVSSGKVTGEALQDLGEISVRLGRLTGQSGQEVAKSFAGMGDDVTAFAVKFNAQYHVLTAVQIEHIRLLQEQGRQTEATAFMSAKAVEELRERGEADLGVLERAWRGVANAIGDAWTAVKGFGNETVGRSNRLQFLNQEIADIEKDGRGSISRYGVVQTKEQMDQRLQAYREERLALNFVVQQEEARAKQQAKNAQGEQAAIRAQEEHARTYRTIGDNAAAAAVEIEKYRAGQAAIRAANPTSRELDSAARAAEIEAAIVKKFTPDATKAATASERLAERLGRQADATNATIAATLALADAYGVSDVEALKAQARTEAVGRAIKAKGDIDTFVTEQMALNAAKLAAQGSKDVSDLRALAGARDLVRAQIASGVVAQEDYSRAVDQELTIRPLLAAALATEGKERERLLKTIHDLRDAYRDLNRSAGIDELEAALKQREDAARAAPDFTALDAAIDKTSRLADSMSYLAESTENAASLMAGAFGRVGEAIGGVSVAKARAQEAIAAINADLARFAQENQNDPARVHEEGIRAAERRRQVEVRANMDALHSAKRLFSEKSAAYKVLTGLEIAYQTIQIAGSIKAMAVDAIATAKSIGNALARGAADAAAGAAKIFAQLGPFGFPVVAAMVGVLAGLGLKLMGGGGGGASVPTAEERQAAQGAGSVLGDSAAKSNSLDQALQIAAANQNRDLEYSSQMVRSLRSIETNIGSLTAVLARQLGVGGALDTSGLGLGTSTSGPSLAQKILNPISALLPGLFGKSVTKTLQDQGLRFGDQSIGDILSGGLQGESYQDILTQTKKKFLGVTVSNKSRTSTQTQDLGADVTAEFTRVIGSLRDGVLAAASVLGVEGAAATLDAFQLSLGDISLKDLKGAELEEALGAVFGKAADQMAGAILPAVMEFQRVGEGAFETIVRLARDYQVVDVALASISKTFGAVGVASIEARERLIDLAGGIDALQEGTAFFAENFLTKAEQLLPVQRAVTAELERLGLAAVDTRDEFKAAVLGLDVSTQAGAEMYAALIALAPAFAKVTEATNDAAAAAEQAAEKAKALARSRRDLEIQGMEALGDTAGATAARREDILAGLDPSLRGLQQVLFNLADAAEAAAKAETAAAEAAEAAATRLAGLEAALKAANDNRTAAEETLRAAYERDASALREHADEMMATARALGDFRRELDTGSIAGRDPVSQYMATKREFDRLSALAANDPDRLANLQGVSQAFLEASRNASPTQLAFDRDLNAVRRAVEASQAAAKTEADIATRQLDALTIQIGQMIELNSGVKSVAAAILGLREAMVMQAVAQAAISGAPGVANDNFDVDRYLAANKDLVKYADANGIDRRTLGTQHYFGTGQYEIAAGLRGYAAGGMHPGGLRIVGEEGPELEATGPARIYSAQDTRRMLSGDDPGLADELRRQNELLAEQNALLRRIVSSTDQTQNELKTMTGDGLYVRGRSPDDPVDTLEAA